MTKELDLQRLRLRYQNLNQLIFDLLDYDKAWMVRTAYTGCWKDRMDFWLARHVVSIQLSISLIWQRPIHSCLHVQWWLHQPFSIVSLHEHPWAQYYRVKPMNPLSSAFCLLWPCSTASVQFREFLSNHSHLWPRLERHAEHSAQYHVAFHHLSMPQSQAPLDWPRSQTPDMDPPGTSSDQIVEYFVQYHFLIN